MQIRWFECQNVLQVHPFSQPVQKTYTNHDYSGKIRSHTKLTCLKKITKKYWTYYLFINLDWRMLCPAVRPMALLERKIPARTQTNQKWY
jgi:hypothetical protein